MQVENCTLSLSLEHYYAPFLIISQIDRFGTLYKGLLAARPSLVRGLCTPLVTTKRRSQERKEGLEPSTSALARLCSTIKLFPPATVVAKHY